MTRRFGGGGAERMTVLLADYFATQGLDVTVLAIDGEDDSYPLNDDVRAVYLHPGAANTIGKVKRLVGIRNYIKREKPDVVITLGGPAKYLSQLKAYEVCDLVLSERNWPPSLYSDADFARIEELYRNSAKVIFQTADARDCFCEEVRAKSAVIPNMVMGDLPPRAHTISNRIVAVGRLEPQKNYDLLLDAFALFLRDSSGDFVLDIYGRGSLEAHLAGKAQALGLEDKVALHGFSNNVHKEIADACMYVTSSDFEGLQNSLLEAMAMGIPCIATDCLGGGAQVITDRGERGLLVPCGDAQALAGAMGRVAADRGLRDRLALRGPEVKRVYSADAICKQWFQYVEGD